MKRLILIILVGFILGFFIVYLTASEEEKLSEAQRLKAELFKLKAQLSQCLLTSEQNALLSDFAKTLNPPANSQFDWNSLSFSSNQIKAKDSLK